MAGAVPLVPKFQFTDPATGNPLAMGWLTVFLAGTSTLANTYTDEALTVPNTNPVHLDANGEAVLWSDPTKRYKWLLQARDPITGLPGVTVPGWPVDNIPGGQSGNLSVDLAGAAGAGLVGFAPGLPSSLLVTVESALRDVPSSVKWFGAVGNGVADDTTALQAALNSGKTVYFPPGVYLTDALLIPTRACIEFAGVAQVTLKLKGSASGNLLSFATTVNERCQLRGGFTIDGNKAAQGVARHGINFLNTGTAAAHKSARLMNCNDPRHFVEEVVIWNCKGDGWHSEGRGENFFGKISAFECDGHGIYVNGFDSTFGELSAGGSGLHGIFFDSSAYNNRVATAKTFFSGLVNASTFGDGFNCAGWYNEIGPLELQDSGRHGLHLFQASHNIFSTVHIESPGTDGTGLSGACGLRLFDSRFNQVRATITDRDVVKSMSYGVHYVGGGAEANYNMVVATVSNAVLADYLFATAGVDMNNYLLLLGTGGPRLVAGMAVENILQVTGGRVRVKNNSTQNFDLRENALEEVTAGFAQVERRHCSPAHASLAGTVVDTFGGGTAGGEYRLNHWSGTTTTNIARGYPSGDFGTFGGAWNTGCLRLGGYRLWADSTGRLRIKNGTPTSDTDGTVVGTQV